MMKELAGSVAIVLSIVGYIPYLRDTFRGKTKPHAFSWTVWTVITFIVGAAQLAAGAGWGTVHNLVTGIICLVIVVYALRNKDKDIKPVDVVLFCAALAAIPLWVVTKNPTLSIVLITVIDTLSFVPTFRKTWHDPGSETLISYVLAGVKYVVSLAAISVYGFATLVYPIALIAMNAIIVGIILVRNGAVKAAGRSLSAGPVERAVD